ncbi:hypothetical protein [Tahibacter soli]|uniref:Uncharacterized protein n=1 Tax=Tahibacter soli TaxID=2983605 RepID=A0A9X4BKT3_9GAMM|nr:hypothetical protein [Tahibacter soli]MDC8014562.1 hypothetical protein [Tahibacter soli]
MTLSTVLPAPFVSTAWRVSVTNSSLPASSRKLAETTQVCLRDSRPPDVDDSRRRDATDVVKVARRFAASRHSTGSADPRGRAA